MLKLFIAVIFSCAPFAASRAFQITNSCSAVFVSGEFKDARKVCKVASDKGEAEAAYVMGLLLELGLGGSVNATNAIAYFELAANGGSRQAADELATIYYDGKLIPPDFEKSQLWLDRAIELGSLKALDRKGFRILQGTGGYRQDFDGARALIEKAAKSGYSNAVYHLGLLYAEGKGVPQNDQLALQYIQSAAALGVAEAKEFLQSDEGRYLANRLAAPQMVFPGSEVLELYVSLHAKPLEDSQEVIDIVEEKIGELPSVFLFELARRKGHFSPEDGAVWFWVAVLRTDYDTRRCVDPNAGMPALISNQAVLSTIREVYRDLATDDPKIRLRAIEIEATLASDSIPAWLCQQGSLGALIQMTGKDLPLEKFVRPRSEWASIHGVVVDRIRPDLPD